MLDVPAWLWATFGIAVVVMLAIDLLAHRKDHVIGFKEAAIWSAVWVGLSLAFAGLVWATLGATPAVEFTTAWLLEKSLSVDNLFVFALIFGYFAVPKEYQHRVLFYGVIGALLFRAIFIGAGVAIVQQFTAVLFLFAAILVFSAWKLIKGGGADYDPSTNPAVRLLKRLVPSQDEYDGHKFFVKKAGKRIATPLLAVVVAIEAADLIFAVDSVPAVLAVSSEPFIVYSSNAFAILGLRALYFLLSGLLDKFHYLDKGLGIILGFIGVKLALQAGHEVIDERIPHLPSWLSLLVIVVVLTGSVVLSLMRPLPPEEAEEPEHVADGEVEGPAGTSTGTTTGTTGTDDDAQPGRASLDKVGPSGSDPGR